MRNVRSKETGLTLKEENFCNEYINNGGNATKAYETAFGRGNGNKTTITTNAYKLKKEDRITMRIKTIRDERERSSAVSREELTMKLVGIVNFDMRRLFKKTKEGYDVPKAVSELTEEEGRMIVGWDKSGMPTIIDKMQALKLIAGVNGLTMPNKVEVSMTGGVLGRLIGGGATRTEGADVDDDYSSL